jgi:hypothetical protein
MKIKLSNNKKQGFSLVEVLVGVMLITVIFFTFYGMYRLSVIIVNQSKNKISAIAISNGQIEKIRSLPYSSVGVIGGFPEGTLESSTTTFLNNVPYVMETRIDFVADPTDGLAYPEDDCPNDYKRVQIKVSWSGILKGEIFAVTDIAPENISQECASEGGILSVSVFDAFGVMVTSPLIEIKDPDTGEVIKTATPDDGQHYFSLATSTYRVEVSRDGYSSERTYGISEVAIPEKSNPTVLENQLAEISFSIDKTSVFSVKTLSPWGSDFFAESFSNENNISEKNNITVSEGSAKLATDTEGYLQNGYLITAAISPASLSSWDEFSFSDQEPVDADARYSIYFASDSAWFLVPESDLPGNSAGFDSSPIDISGLSASVYTSLEIGANLSTQSTTSSPEIYDLQVSWITSEPTQIPNAQFSLSGSKIIGKDGEEKPVYKYSISTTTDGEGNKTLSSLEWDSYTFSVATSTGLDLVAVDPTPQPINLAPDFSQEVKLYIDSQNSLLITLEDLEDLTPIFSGTVRVYNSSLGYDETLYTDSDGQVIFLPLNNAVYNLEISASGYSATSTIALVSGDSNKIIKLEKP